MRKRTVATAAVAGLSVLNGTAMAASPAPISWTGFYFGVETGANFQTVGYDHPVFRGDVHTSGFYGGGLIGYNFHVAPTWVFGLEAGGGFSNIEQTNVIGGADLTTKSPWEFTLRGRTGYLIDPQKLIYLTGGLVRSRHEVSFPGLSESFNRTGFVIGGGVEFGSIVPGWHFRIEYTHSDFGTQRFFGDLPVDLSQQAVRASFTSKPLKAPPPAYVRSIP